MALNFTDKKRRWPPSKPVQYILAIALLVIAVIILLGWLFIRFVYTDSPSDETPQEQDSSVVSIDDLPDSGRCLIIVENVGYERFALVTASPKDQHVTVTALSPDMSTADGVLSDTLRKYGPSRAAQSVADVMGLPSMHYMSFSISDIETLFTRLGENLSLSIPEEITYKDENGATVRLKAETRRLTPAQIASIFRYDQWKDSANSEGLAADVTVAVLNEYLRPGKSLKGYFELLSNTATTDLRIDQFNAYAIGWEFLASVNQGAVAQRTDKD